MKSNYSNILVLSLFIFCNLEAQIRPIDCYGVNPENPTWGMTGDTLINLTRISFTDGISEPAGQNRKNPRVISNTIFAQDGDMPNERNLSDFVFGWGQVVDHDVALVRDTDERFDIPVPKYDPWMDPFGAGNKIIPLHRSIFNEGTGTSQKNPRRFVNSITAYLDGSVLYGSDDHTASWLRSYVDGKLKTSAGNLLPYNTTTGEFDDSVDPNAPVMDMRDNMHNEPRHFVAGDARVNEVPLLISMHTILVREHNYQCDRIKEKHPDWNDEQIYQRARKMVGGFIQHVTFSEWWPLISGRQLSAYNGFNPNINSQMSNLFSAAAFRIGHSIVNGSVPRMDDHNKYMDDHRMVLAECYFKPGLIRDNNGIEVFIKGACFQRQQAMDIHIIDELRNALFGPPGAGGLDLAAINIQRGRERGLADFNTLRTEYGLEAYTRFNQISGDNVLNMRLYELYDGDINNIDPFVGLYAEKPIEGSIFGEMLTTVITEQMVRFRDGDPFYFMIDPELTEEEKHEIQNTTLGDIVRRATKLYTVPRSIFIVEPNPYEVRTITGINNNIENPDWGAVFTRMERFGTNAYADQISAPAGENRPNTREISNSIFAQQGDIFDNMELSSFVFNWGQFIDHDLTLVTDSEEPIFIEVPAGDPWFDPYSTGTKTIRMFRSKYDELSGTSPANPRQHPNEVTAYIDGSVVYGSTPERTDYLRLFENGKLRVSEGNMMPYNTISGEYDDETDPYAPHMGRDVVPPDGRWFISGDERANENPLLIAMHTLWVREHNRICDELAAANPYWSDESLFQAARKIVGGKIANITLQEWLPAMGIYLDKYKGYDPEIKAQAMNLFSAAAFRFGHTIINGTIRRMSEDCVEHPMGNMSLKDAFFNIAAIRDETDNQLEPYFLGMMRQRQQGRDAKVIDDVRNFLFGEPGSGGLDLVAINIQRGRERGVADYNTTRVDFGLPPLSSFDELSDDRAMTKKLEELYGDINELDLWVGICSEKYQPGSIFGELEVAILKKQFHDFRNGDRFYFEMDEGIPEVTKKEIRYTTLADVLALNTDLEYVPNNVFIFQGICTDVDDLDEIVADISLYPNPASDFVNVEMSSAATLNGEITISNVLGQTFGREEMRLLEGYNSFRFDVSLLPAGMYFITINSEKSNLTRRFLKN